MFDRRSGIDALVEGCDQGVPSEGAFVGAEVVLDGGFEVVFVEFVVAANRHARSANEELCRDLGSRALVWDVLFQADGFGDVGEVGFALLLQPGVAGGHDAGKV